MREKSLKKIDLSQNRTFEVLNKEHRLEHHTM